MNTILWTIQVVLAALFGLAGIIKIVLPKERLIKSGLKWVLRIPVSSVRFIGLSELLGAIGLILPMLLNRYTILTPLAACGFLVIMIFAAYHHYRYSENKAIILNIVIMVLSAIIAIGRFISI